MKKQESDAFVRGLDIIMKAEGWKMKPLGEAAGYGETTVRDLYRNNSSPKVSTAYALAQVLGRSVDEIIQLGTDPDNKTQIDRRAISVVGHVGAGAEIALFDAYEKGDGHYRIQCPPQLSPKGMVAVEVVGDSMAPVYMPGAILFYTRTTMGVPTEAVGQICVCEDADGQAWVKQVRTGREEGTFTLVSMNPDHDHRHGVHLKWAAPVRFALPPEFVRRVD